MYRSQEIITILYTYNIPDYITKYILDLERQKNFKDLLNDWKECECD